MGWRRKIIATAAQDARTPPPAGPASSTTRHGRGITEHWQTGNLAECINTGLWYLNGIEPVRTGPAYSEVRMVRRVVLRRHPLSGEMLELLGFDAWPQLFAASAFRKITPKADEAITHDRHFLDAWLPAREHA